MNEVLPPGWSWARLENLSAAIPRAITDGPFGSNLKTEHYTDEGALVVRLQNIGDGFYVDEPAYIGTTRFERLRQHEVKPGDVLIAALGTQLPRACVAPPWLPPAIVKADCFRVRPNPEINAKYLVAVLNSPPMRMVASKLISGVGRPRINLAKVRKLRVPVPPKAEQDRIATAIDTHFSNLDAGIESLERARRKLGRMKKAVLRSVIPDPVLPSHWSLGTVQDAGHVDLGRQRAPKYHSGTHMRPYLRVANVFEDRIDLTSVKTMHFPPEQYEKYCLREGDILLNEGQTPELVGRPAMYRGELPGACFTNSLIRFRPKPHIDHEFALLVFRHHLHSGRFKKEAQITTNIAHMAAGRFKRVEFPFPTIEEQRQIVLATHEQLTRLMRMEVEVERALTRTRSLRRSILRKAFEGGLVAQDPTDETASLLLERIRSMQPDTALRQRNRTRAPA